MKKKFLLVLAGFLGISLCVGTLNAREKIGRSCKADVKKFCKEVEPGEGRIHQCLKKHHKNLSTECKDGMREAKQKKKEFEQACQADHKKFCKHEDGEFRKCLKKHKKELSEECRKKWK